MMTDFICAEFRRRRDAFQRERREGVIDGLRAQLATLEAQVSKLKVRWQKADKHHQQSISDELKPIEYECQYFSGQVSAIEREMFIPYALGFAIRQ